MLIFRFNFWSLFSLFVFLLVSSYVEVFAFLLLWILFFFLLYGSKIHIRPIEALVDSANEMAIKKCFPTVVSLLDIIFYFDKDIETFSASIERLYIVTLSDGSSKDMLIELNSKYDKAQIYYMVATGIVNSPDELKKWID